MNLSVRKRIAAKALKCGIHKVRFNPDVLDKIKEAITTLDIKQLIADGAIKKDPTNLQSRGRARAIQKQKSKGRRRGQGKRKGKVTARASKKETWMNKIRAQRKFLSALRENKKINAKTYRNLYSKAKGGFFRSRKHIKLYMEEKKLFK